MRMIIRNKSLIIMVLFTIFCLFIILSNTHPYIGMKLTQDNNHDFYVDRLDEFGWAWQSGVKIGDQVILINDHPPEQHPTVLNNLLIENADTITTLTNGVYKTHQVNYTIELTQQVVYYLLIPTLYFLTSLIICGYLYKNHKKSSSEILIYLNLLLSTCYLSATLSAKLIPIGQHVLNLTFLIAPIVFLHFIYYLMEEYNKTYFSKKVLFILYVTGVLSFIILTFNQSRQLLLISFLLIITTVSTILIKGFSKVKRDELKKPYKLIFYSFAIGLAPFILLYVIPLLVWNTTLIRPEFLTLFIFAVPMTFLFLLTSGKLYALKIYIKKLPYYSVIALIVTTVVLIMYFSISEKKLSLDSLSMLFLSTFIIFLISYYLKYGVDRALRSSFSIEGNLQQSLYRHSEQIKKEKDLEGIIEALQREVKEVLDSKELDVMPLR